MEKQLEILEKNINEYFNLSLRDKTRNRKVAACKRLFIKLAYEMYPELRLNQIAGFVYNHPKDHSVSIYHLKRYKDMPREHKIFYNEFIEKNNIDTEKFEIKEVKPINKAFINKETKQEINIESKKLKELLYLINEIPYCQLDDFINYRLKPYLQMNKNVHIRAVSNQARPMV